MTLLVAVLLAGAPAGPSALERLAQDVARTVTTAGFAGPVGVYVEGSPAPMSRAVGSVVMATLARQQLAPVPVTARDATEAERLAREQGLGSLVRLTVSLEAPRLVVRGDALSAWVNFWSGSTPTRTGPAAAIATSVDADLEALTLAGGPPPSSPRPLELSLGVITRLSAVPAALTLADLDGDQKAELIVLAGEAVLTLGADGRVRARHELTGPAARWPSRDAFGTLSVSGDKLVAWSARRERAERLQWQQGAWRSLGAPEAVTVGPLTLTPRPGASSFAKDFMWAGQALSWPEPLQQVNTFGTLMLGVSPLGSAAVARGVAPAGQVGGVGSGTTLADLDGDGTAELVATSARTVGDVDEVRVVALGAFESAQARGGLLNEVPVTWSRKLEGRALVAASGDLDGDGVDEVVLGTWLSDGTGELLVLRRSP